MFVRQFLDIHHFVMSASCRADNFVEFQLDRDRVTALAILNDKKHENRDDRRKRANDKLPRIIEMKDRTQQTPKHNDQKCQKARERLRGFIGQPFCNS